MLDPEEPEIARCSCVCGRAPSAASIDEEEEVDAGRPGDHVANEALVAGHVDEREPAPVRQLERRVAEVD